MPQVYADRATFVDKLPVLIRPDWVVVDVVWFHQGLSYGPLVPVIGIILTKTDYGCKAYAGIGLGLDFETDMKMIAEHGGKLPHDIAARFWPEVKLWAA